MLKLSRQRKKARGSIKKIGECYSSELMTSINNRVDTITNERLVKQPAWTTDQILTNINKKITSMCTKNSDQLRQLQRIFGSGSVNKELTPQEFQNKIAKLGIGLTQTQSNALFVKIDADNSGGISLREFVAGIIPKEITAEPWYEHRRKQMTQDTQNSKTTRGAINTNMFRQTLSKTLPTRTPQQICNVIYARIVSLSKRPTDQLRRIRRIFSMSEKEDSSTSSKSRSHTKRQLTAQDLRRTLANIEVLLKDDEVGPLFDFFDQDRSGTIDMQEFLKAVMPLDITHDNPWDKREANRQKELQKSKQLNARLQSQGAVASSFCTDALPNLTTKEIKYFLLDKINQFSKKPTDRIRKVSQIFKRGSIASSDGSAGEHTDVSLQTGITSSKEFAMNIEKLGLTLTEQQAEDLFQELDTDSSGTVSLSEFLSGLLPNDYSRESWHTKSQQSQLSINRKKKLDQHKKGKSNFNSGQQPHLSTSDIIHLIRSKMEMFSSKPSDAFRQITRIFGSSGDCDLKTFHSHVHKLRVYLTDDQANKLFAHFE